jgi:hypothetical protein
MGTPFTGPWAVRVWRGRVPEGNPIPRESRIHPARARARGAIARGLLDVVSETPDGYNVW